MENSFNQNRVYGWGELAPTLLPEHLPEERHRPTAEMDPRQRQTDARPQSGRLAPRTKIPHAPPTGLYRGASRRTLKLSRSLFLAPARRSGRTFGSDLFEGVVGNRVAQLLARTKQDAFAFDQGTVELLLGQRSGTAEL